MALDLNQCFLTATDCTEIERYAAYDFTTTSMPTLAQVESYAYMAASILQALTQRAGSLKIPPASGVSPTWLKVMLTEANAIGAAYLARHHIYTLNGDARSLKEMERLAGLWQSFVGVGAIATEAGVAALQYGNGGLIQAGIESASGSRLLVTPVSQGELELEDMSGDSQSVTFKRTDVD